MRNEAEKQEIFEQSIHRMIRLAPLEPELLVGDSRPPATSANKIFEGAKLAWRARWIGYLDVGL